MCEKRRVGWKGSRENLFSLKVGHVGSLITSSSFQDIYYTMDKQSLIRGREVTRELAA
jgi:hypothetical protein